MSVSRKHSTVSPLPLRAAPQGSTNSLRGGGGGGGATRGGGGGGGIFKMAESHVRVVSYANNFSVAADRASLRARLPSASASASSSSSTSQHHTNTNTSSSNNNNSNSNAAGGWSEPYEVTRVHLGGADTRAFYSEVVAPCVSNSTGGQSYLFLVCGAAESGRSQTMYGSPHHREKGLVELAAEDYIQRMRSRANALVSARKNPNNNNDNNNNNNDNNANSDAGGGLMVTYSAFTTRGGQMVETVGGAPVVVEDFPAPLGRTPLPRMRLLDSGGSSSNNTNNNNNDNDNDNDNDDSGESKSAAAAAAATVLLPERKHSDTSCVIQFQVYAPVDGTGRRSFATLTFVDVAAFTHPLGRDVSHLVETIRRVVGDATDGITTSAAAAAAASPNLHNNHNDNSDSGGGGGGGATHPPLAPPPQQQQNTAIVEPPDFAATQLTALLEPALGGYVTLVGITTVSGRDDLRRATHHALSLAARVARVSQALTLVHLSAPRWLFDAARRVGRLAEERQAALAGAYARGVRDFYSVARRWLSRQVGDPGAELERLLCETESVRRGLAAQVNAHAARVQAEAQAEAQAAASEAEAARAAAAEAARLAAQIAEAEEAAAAAARRAGTSDRRAQQAAAEMRAEAATLQAAAAARAEEMARLQREHQTYRAKAAAVSDALASATAAAAAREERRRCLQELTEIGRKRARVEEELEMAAAYARARAGTQRHERERRARYSKVAAAESRVESLRATVRASSASLQRAQPNTAPHSHHQHPHSKGSNSDGGKSGGAGGGRDRGNRGAADGQENTYMY